MPALPIVHAWVRRMPANAIALILPNGETRRFGDGAPQQGGLRILHGDTTSLACGLIDAALSGNTAFPLPPGLQPKQPHALLALAQAAATPKLALIIATSGSSGQPKGVRLSWRAIAAASRMSARALDLQRGDAWLVCLPLYHIGGAMILYRCLRAGATAVVHDGFDVAAIARDLTVQRITHLSLVPAMLAKLLEAGVQPAPTLKCVLVGGAALNDTLREQARAAGWPIRTSWGMSETSAMITLDGRPLPGVRLRVAQTGVLEVATPARMTGYLSESDINEWVTTHDLGHLDAEGRVHILGRADAMLISGGENIHPLEVEALLTACPGLREVGITGLHDPAWGDIVACAYRGEITETALADWCRAHIPAARRPRRFLRLGHLPHLASGKLDRCALPKLWPLHHDAENLVDWTWVANELERLARTAGEAQLLSVTLPLSRWPVAARLTPTDGIFWQRPDAGLRMLGMGRACHFTSTGTGRFAALQAAHRGLMESLRYTPNTPPPLAFTGFAFAPHGGAPLPNTALWVPELLLREQAGKIWLTLSYAVSHFRHAMHRWQAQWQALQAKDTLRKNETTQARCAMLDAQPNPITDALFRARGRVALEAITRGLVDKLVLTRTLHLDSGVPIPPEAILTTLAAQQPNCAIYGVSQEGRVFLGASPETLLTLRGDQVSADALAGTAWHEAALPLSAHKNHREHDFVAHAIAQALAPLCLDLRIPATPEVMQLHGLSHLRRRVTAQRQPTTSAFDLIARLHPTSAVGGVPREAALDWLAHQGDIRSAWYTGGVGWIDAHGDCDIAVALRCGLFEGGAITLQAGAGFVAGSVVEQEFAETEAKFHTLREAIACACKHREPA